MSALPRFVHLSDETRLLVCYSADDKHKKILRSSIWIPGSAFDIRVIAVLRLPLENIFQCRRVWSITIQRCWLDELKRNPFQDTNVPEQGGVDAGCILRAEDNRVNEPSCCRVSLTPVLDLLPLSAPFNPPTIFEARAKKFLFPKRSLYGRCRIDFMSWIVTIDPEMQGRFCGLHDLKRTQFYSPRRQSVRVVRI